MDFAGYTNHDYLKAAHQANVNVLQTNNHSFVTATPSPGRIQDNSSFISDGDASSHGYVIGKQNAWDAHLNPCSQLTVSISGPYYKAGHPVSSHNALLGVHNPFDFIGSSDNARDAQLATVRNPLVGVQDGPFAIQNTPFIFQNTSVNIQDNPFAIQNASANIQDARFTVQNASANIQDTRFAVQNTLANIQDARFAVQNASAHIQDTRFAIQNAPFANASANIQDALFIVPNTSANIQDTRFVTQNAPFANASANIHDAPFAVPSTSANIQDASFVIPSVRGVPFTVPNTSANIQDAPFIVPNISANIWDALFTIPNISANIWDAPFTILNVPANIGDATAVQNASANIQDAPFAIQNTSAVIEDTPFAIQDAENASTDFQRALPRDIEDTTVGFQHALLRGIRTSSRRPSHGLNSFHPYNCATSLPNAGASLISASLDHPRPPPLPSTSIHHPAPLSSPSHSLSLPSSLPSIVPHTAQASAAPSLFLPRTNQIISSASHLPPNAPKGPLVTTSAHNFEEYCEIHNYKRLPAMYQPKHPGTERTTASTYFAWANVRDLARESVGYSRGLGFRKYKIFYDNGAGKMETFESVLLNRLGWNIGTFTATTRLFEAAENLTMNFIWDPMQIPTASANGFTGSGTFALAKSSLYEVWKGMVYLFHEPGFFKNHHEPLQSVDKSEEEQIAAQVSQNDIHHHLSTIQDFLVSRIDLKPLKRR